MKSPRLVLLFLGAAVTASFAVLGFSRLTFADSTTLTSDQLQAIQTNCMTLQQTLTQLNHSDTAVRVNQGQYYEEISSQLMAPMNSRIALNHYNGADLVTTAADFSNTLATFRSQYKTYANNLSKAMGIDCTKKPQQFYDAISTARTDRLALHTTVLALNGMVTTYDSQFTTFAQTLPLSSNGAEND